MGKRLRDDLFFNICAEEILHLTEVREMDAFLQHGRTTCLEHCVRVASLGYFFCVKTGLDCDRKSLIRGALLHDFFLYDWHEKDSSHRLHGFSHPKAALRNAERCFSLNEIERDIIEKHMWPMTIRPPKCKEALIICLADKCCAVFETMEPCCRWLWRKGRRFLPGRAFGKTS